MLLGSLYLEKVIVDGEHKTDKRGYKLYSLKKPLPFSIDKLDFEVPIGFITDIASVPYPFNKIFKRNYPRYRKSAICHDYLYSIRFNRKKADEYFYRFMALEGASLWKSALFYGMVRCFGWIRYKQFSSKI